MDITTRLKQTLTYLEEAEVPSELRAVAFEKVFDLVSSAGSTPRSDKHAEPHREGEGASGRADASTPLGRIAERLHLEVSEVDQVFFIGEDELELVLPPAKLDRAKWTATQEIALLVAAGRQAAGLDSDGWTKPDPIRVVCEHYKKYDSGNFAAALKDMDDVFTFRGNGRDRKIRMTAPGWDKAVELVRRLLDHA